MDHYDLADVFGLSNFTFSLFRNLSLTSVIISEQYFEYVLNCSIFIIGGFGYYFFLEF